VASEFLEANLKEFEGWECDCCPNSNTSRYESVVEEFREILRSHSLVGYHCTKLTREEIDSTSSNGLVLQNGVSLGARIDRILRTGSISPEVAHSLKEENQADECNRKNMLWFCFYAPSIAGECGIGRFFRFWGGEALYNSHENNPTTRPLLRSLGIPSIVKVNLPISSMKDTSFPDGAMARVLLSSADHRLKKPITHEGYSIRDVSAQNIIQIIEHPSESFIELTECKAWKKYAI